MVRTGSTRGRSPLLIRASLILAVEPLLAIIDYGLAYRHLFTATQNPKPRVMMMMLTLTLAPKKVVTKATREHVLERLGLNIKLSSTMIANHTRPSLVGRVLKWSKTYLSSRIMQLSGPRFSTLHLAQCAQKWLHRQATMPTNSVSFAHTAGPRCQ